MPSKPPTTELSLLRSALTDPVARLACADWLEEQGRAEEAAAVREAAGFVHRVDFLPAFDKRHADPHRNYGIHGVDMRMTLIGSVGAISFSVFTNWHLPHVAAEQWERPERTLLSPMAADIVYHAKTPQYEGQQRRDKVCEYLGVPCYHDGSATAAEEVFGLLLREGGEGVWKHLRERYREQFGG